jgi:hypothetical protein
VTRCIATHLRCLLVCVRALMQGSALLHNLVTQPVADRTSVIHRYDDEARHLTRTIIVVAIRKQLPTQPPKCPRQRSQRASGTEAINSPSRVCKSVVVRLRIDAAARAGARWALTVISLQNRYRPGPPLHLSTVLPVAGTVQDNGKAHVPRGAARCLCAAVLRSSRWDTCAHLHLLPSLRSTHCCLLLTDPSQQQS